jgi:hypothetical protein
VVLVAELSLSTAQQGWMTIRRDDVIDKSFSKNPGHLLLHLRKSTTLATMSFLDNGGSSGINERCCDQRGEYRDSAIWCDRQRQIRHTASTAIETAPETLPHSLYQSQINLPLNAVEYLQTVRQIRTQRLPILSPAIDWD